jgi:hypothetical protein
LDTANEIKFLQRGNLNLGTVHSKLYFFQKQDSSNEIISSTNKSQSDWPQLFYISGNKIPANYSLSTKLLLEAGDDRPLPGIENSNFNIFSGGTGFNRSPGFDVIKHFFFLSSSPTNKLDFLSLGIFFLGSLIFEDYEVAAHP